MNQEPGNPKPGITGRLSMAGWRKHYVAAMTADEESWPQEESRGLGRVFIILLLLHVFLIGSVVLYNVISPKSPPPIVAVAKPGATTPATTVKTMPATGAAARSITSPATPPPPKADVKPIETGTYEVRSGDNVPGIASTLGVAAEELIKLNNLDNTELFPGRKLTYPKKTAASPPAARVPSAIPIPSITSSNNAIPGKPETFKAVEPVTIKPSAPPAKPKDAAAVTIADAPPKPSANKVAAADTPPARPQTREESSGGAKPKTEAKKETAKTENKTEPAKPKTTAKNDKPSSKDTAGRRSHVVGPKETLYSIAKKYGVKVEALQKANTIKDPTTLREGQKLVIPPKN